MSSVRTGITTRPARLASDNSFFISSEELAFVEKTSTMAQASPIARTIASLREVRRIVLTDYMPGQKMIDLPRSVAVDDVTPRYCCPITQPPVGVPSTDGPTVVP